MKVWITKYALTQGIFEIEGEHTYDIKGVDYDTISDTNKCNTLYFGKDKDWSLTKESAIKVADVMRLKKIESLKKQIVKLEKMKFE